ncbi:ribokinase [Microvirga sp. Mcv34]|uniref:ribokinase n=1 Tax=Microvirga sp. Mcv34 TaxID=2926016 RepID=UPI0021C95131|nr:ribokinase [Microvirga sp. Mcv34]
MSRVTVLGNATVDLLQRVSAFPKPGETLLSAGIERCAGGKGLNQALSASRAGAFVRLVAAIGDDPDGAFLRAALTSEDGLAVDWCIVAAPTDVSSIWIADTGENMIVSSAACARGLREDEALARLAPVTAGDVLVLQGNLTAAVTMAAARFGRERGAQVILNTAPIAWDMRLLLQAVDIVVANQPEAQSLTGEAGEAALTELLALGAGCAIVTLGAAGAMLSTGGSVVTIPAPAVEAVDTAGAGDVTVGTLAAGIAAGEPVANALSLAIAAASLSVTRPGTSPSFPTRAEMAHLRSSPVV